MATTADKPRNVYARKLAVMAKCGEITPDKKHPAHGFMYVSIQTLSNHLRKFCVEEGLDITSSEADGRLVFTLTNVDDPSDNIISIWPVVAGDKGYAYSHKYPLMRLFLVGDGEENDEAEMATKSGAAATQSARTAVAPAKQSIPAITAVRGGPCPICAEEHILNRKGGPAHFWTRDGRTQCDGMQDGRWVNHGMVDDRPLTGVGAATRAQASTEEIPWE